MFYYYYFFFYYPKIRSIWLFVLCPHLYNSSQSHPFSTTNTIICSNIISISKSINTHSINYYTIFINYKFHSIPTTLHSNLNSILSILITISNFPLSQHLSYIILLHYTVIIITIIMTINIILFNINPITILTFITSSFFLITYYLYSNYLKHYPSIIIYNLIPNLTIVYTTL